MSEGVKPPAETFPAMNQAQQQIPAASPSPPVDPTASAQVPPQPNQGAAAEKLAQPSVQPPAQQPSPSASSNASAPSVTGGAAPPASIGLVPAIPQQQPQQVAPTSEPQSGFQSSMAQATNRMPENMMQQAQQGFMGGAPSMQQLQQQQQPQAHFGAQQQQQQQQQQEGKVLKVEDALTYLDEVKRQFGDQPHIYNMFLEIMKSFKAEAIDTPGVIQKVSELFRGHNNLILGFNTFLPPGYRIENSDLPPDTNPPSQQQQPQMQGLPPPPPNAAMGLHAAHLMQQGHPQMLAQSMVLGPNGPQILQMDPSFLMGQSYYADPSTHPQYMMMMHDSMQQQHMQQPGMHQAAAAGQPVEFDHAINYVTKIKRRFANDADTYKAFLEILHTYQKEQKSIKEVLDQVSELFKDHSDLLTEFTYFLPDGVREKAKQEISKIQKNRRKDERRKNEKKEMQLKGAQGLKKDGKDKGLGVSSMMGGSTMMGSMLMGSQKALSPMGLGRKDMQDEMDEVQDERLPQRGGIHVSLPAIPRLEEALYNRIREALGTRERWISFVKLLKMFHDEVITRQELLAVCSDLFRSELELLEEFDRLLASRGVTDDMTEDAWFAVPVADIDFSQSRRCTPSYRSLPPNYPKPPCSERTALCRAVLNDVWIAVPTGTDDSTFKTMRRNQYEEALFRCEDDRFELDLVIEANLSAIQTLEQLARTMEEKRPEIEAQKDEPRYRIDRRTLSVIHLKAIARVYGERAKEVFELLRKSPSTAVPVILARLKSKDSEWRKLQAKMNETWREVQEKNYIKSLDHRSFYFKANEKKILTPKYMVSEIREAPAKNIVLEFPDALAHRHAAALINACAERSLTKPELDRCGPVLERILAKLLGLRTMGGKQNTATKSGTKVLTRYGMGTIASVAGNQVEVKLIAVHGTSVKVPKEEVFEAPPFSFKEPEGATYLIGQNGYLFLRFYAILCERMTKMEALVAVMEKEQRPQIKPLFERIGSESDEGEAKDKSESLFTRTMELMKNYLRGAMDTNKYEDDMYNLLGNQSYFLFTIDKLLNLVVRSLTSMLDDEKTLKVANAAAKYTEKKTASNAVDVYTSIGEALALASSCPAARVRLVPGSNPYAPPQKKLADIVSDASGNVPEVVLASVDLLWETAPQVIIEVLDSIPQGVTYGAAASGRSLSPVGFDADGTAVATEMGEIEFALPCKVDMRIKGSPAIPHAASLDDSSKQGKKVDESNGVTLSIFSVEKLPGSDDVFRRINAFKSERQTEKDWWKSANQVERNVSPVPEDDESSSEDAPPGKRMRSAAEESAE